MTNSRARLAMLSLISAALFVLVGASAAAVGASAAAVGAQDELSEVAQLALAHVESMTQAYGDNDVDRYLNHYASNHTRWTPRGRQSRDEYHSWWSEVVANTGGVASAEVTDPVVQVSASGDTAVVSYVLVANYYGGDGDGSTSTSHIQISTTMMRRGTGSWTIVHLHFQMMPDAE